MPSSAADWATGCRPNAVRTPMVGQLDGTSAELRRRSLGHVGLLPEMVSPTSVQVSVETGMLSCE